MVVRHNESIHPRVFLHGKKKNTCKSPTKAPILRAKAGIERHIKLHPKDTAAHLRLLNLNRRLGDY